MSIAVILTVFFDSVPLKNWLWDLNLNPSIDKIFQVPKFVISLPVEQGLRLEMSLPAAQLSGAEGGSLT